MNHNNNSTNECVINNVDAQFFSFKQKNFFEFCAKCDKQCCEHETHPPDGLLHRLTCHSSVTEAAKFLFLSCLQFAWNCFYTLRK